MTTLRFEDVAPGADLFLALVRGRFRVGPAATLGDAARGAAARTLDRGAIVSALRPRLIALGAPAASLAAVDRLLDPRCVVVVAGQQPVLFGGPHLVVSKALAAVATAERIEAETGLPAVPLFWVAGEDHDHAEVEHVDVVLADGSLETLSAALPHDRAMLSRTPLDAHAAFSRLCEVLGDGPGSAAAAEIARPTAGDDVATAFSRTILRLVGRFGVAVVEPSTVRALARDVVLHEIEEPGALAAAVIAAEDSVAAAGFARPLGYRGRDVWFVVDRRGRRHRPQAVPGPDDEAGRAKWRRRVDAEPDAFSWDVAGRVLAQDVALPVAAQVCGPAEFGYCSAIAPAHALLGVPAPALVPRPGFTAVEPRAADACAAAGVSVEDAVRGVRAVPGAPSLRPAGGLQERSASILPFVSRHGSGMLDALLAAFRNPEAEHVVLALGDARDVR